LSADDPSSSEIELTPNVRADQIDYSATLHHDPFEFKLMNNPNPICAEFSQPTADQG
jgi:hypothetical protein